MIYVRQKIGLLQGVTMDEKQRRVRALIVSCGMHGKRLIPAEMVHAISNAFILVGGTEKYVRHQEIQLGRMIRDTSGLLTGYATDFALDEKNLEIIALEMAFGYLFRQNRNRIWVYRYTVSDAGELIIPATLRSELIDFKEED